MRRSRGQSLWDSAGRGQAVAFGFVLAAYVLKYADVPCVDEYLVSLRQDRHHVWAVIPGGAFGGVIGGAGQENRCVLRFFGQYDDGVQLDSVAHGDHHFALDIILARGWGSEDFGNVAVGDRMGRFLGGGTHRRRGHGEKRREQTRSQPACYVSFGALSVEHSAILASLMAAGDLVPWPVRRRLRAEGKAADSGI
jgi:hypothetical protein